MERSGAHKKGKHTNGSNTSPWYAFKLWSETESEIYFKLTYRKGVGHRYFPKLSHDGLNWNPLDSVNYQQSIKLMNEELELPEDMTMKLSIGPDTLWIAAQEFDAYKPNIKPRSGVDAKVSTLTYFFYEFGAESLVYEIGDDTPREFVRKKGEVSALKLMELMLERKTTNTK